MIRLLIVDPDPWMGNLMASVLQNQTDIQVVGVAHDVQAALARLPECDLMLVSAHLPAGHVLELTRQCKAIPAKVIITGLIKSRALLVPYIEAGAVGYVMHDSSAEELIRTIRVAQRGEALISPALGTALIERMQELLALSRRMVCEPPPAVDTHSKLTEREQEILVLMSQGLTNQAIATKLVIELGTVKNHVHHILKKLEVSNRAAAVHQLTALSDSSRTLDPAVRPS